MESKLSRRNFLKTGVIVGTGFYVPNLWIRSAFGALEPGFSIHPNLDDGLVVGITDPKMIAGHQAVTTWAQQEAMVNTPIVWENMDKMACKLSGENTAKTAWKTILVKPPNKSFSDAVVAIKTNGISRQHTRSAVMSKVCHALVNEVGVKPGNIHIYDACHGGDIKGATPFSGLPEGCRIENKWGGFSQETAVPEPWNGGTSKCLGHLTDDSVDILINISMCKGHGNKFGKFTMTMKNHFGTFAPRPGHGKEPLEYLLALNRTPEIMGSVSPKNGRVIYPRQQLCIVDALWSSSSGPGGNPTDQTNFLAMGAVSPVVDYQVATNFRRDTMGWEINEAAAKRFLSEFGYSAGDLPNGGKILAI